MTEVVATSRCVNCGEWLDQLSNGRWQHKISGVIPCDPNPPRMATPDTGSIEATTASGSAAILDASDA